MLAVGSITWPHFSHFRVNNLATYKSITWPPFRNPLFIFFGFLSALFSGAGAKFVFEKLFLVKQGVFRKWVVHFLRGGVEGLGDCCCMILLDALEGCSKNHKNSFFFTTLLLDAENRKTGQKKKKRKIFTPLFGGP